MNVLFLGGSNTWGAGVDDYEDSYAAKVSHYLEARFPGTRIFNMSIGGTGSRLCSFMIRDHLQTVTPDMVFFEYSINDSNLALACKQNVLRDTEYVIRTILEHCPRAYCLMLHFAKRDFMSCTETHREIARHYHLDSLDLQSEMKQLTNAGALWDAYFVDAVHPNQKGHAFYARKICEFLDTYPDEMFLNREAAVLPDRYSPAFYNNPTIVPAETLLQSEFWTPVPYHDVKRNDAVLVNRYVQCSALGETVEFAFSGHTFGIYHLVRKDGGKLRICVDGQEYTLDCYYPCDGDFVDFFNVHNLKPGIHQVGITVINDKNVKSQGNYVGITGFLVD